MRADHAEQAEVEEAIARILQAERDAREAVGRCEAQAAARVAAAREQAAAIDARADRRIAALRARIDAAVDRRVAELDASDPKAGPATGHDPAADELFSRAAAAALRELTGAGQ